MTKTTMQFGKKTLTFYDSILTDVNQARIAYAQARYVELPRANKTKLRVMRKVAMRMLNVAARRLWGLIKMEKLNA